MSLALIGWTVVQSLWQWSLIGGATVLILGLLQDRSARRRHAICCVSLLLMIVTSVVTLIAAGVRVEPAFRAQVLYAFDGVAIVPAIVESGLTILLVAGALWLAGLTRSARARRSGLEARPRSRCAHPANPSRRICRRSSTSCTNQWTCGGRSPCGRHRRAAVPMVVGWRRPMILLPAAAVHELTRLAAPHDPPPRARTHPPPRRHRQSHAGFCECLDVSSSRGAMGIAETPYRARILLRRCGGCRVGGRGGVCTCAGAARRAPHRSAARGCGGVGHAAGSHCAHCRSIGREAVQRGAAAVLGVTAVLVAATLFALSANLPPPWLPAGVRLRRPAPPGQTIGPPMESQPRLKRQGRS